MSRYVCLGCGANSEGEKPHFCLRCGSVESYCLICNVPGYAPPSRIPRPVGSLLEGLLPAYHLSGIWERLGAFGRPCQFLLHGDPGSGKTFCALEILEQLAGLWGSGVYFSTDEGIQGLSFRRKVLDLELRRMFIADGMSWREISGELNRCPGWAVVCVDTASRASCVADELASFTRGLGTSWLVVLENLKSGDFSGPETWLHWADIAVCVTRRENKQRISVIKNRFGQLFDMDREVEENVTVATG